MRTSPKARDDSPYGGRRDRSMFDTPEQLLHRGSEFGFDACLDLRPRYGLDLVLQLAGLLEQSRGDEVGLGGQRLPDPRVSRHRPDSVIDSRLATNPGGWPEKPEPASALDRFGATVHFELRIDVTHVRLDRAGRQVELGGDLGRGQVAGQEAENAELAVAQVLSWLE